MLQVIGNFETTIAAKLTTAGTSLTLTTATDSEGNALPAGTYGFTLNEGKTNEEHIIGTLSGSTVTITKRNVRRTDGTTAGTGKEHRKGSSIKITNFPVLALISRALLGTDTLPAVLKYASGVIPATADDLADKGYVDGVAIAGAPNSSTTVKGISKSSTAPTDSANPVHVEDTDPRLPTQDENNALVGTSSTAVSSSNKLVDAADVAENTAGKIVRRKSDSNITVPATPTASTDAVSKSYADTLAGGVAASDTIIASADTERSTTNTTPTMVKEIVVQSGGTLRFTWELRHDTNTSFDARARIYRNGVAVGTEQSTNQTSYQSKTDDVSGWTKGDLVQLYIYKQSGGVASYIRNFKIKGSLIPSTTVNTD